VRLPFHNNLAVTDQDRVVEAFVRLTREAVG
jgi:hypothetical protein